MWPNCLSAEARMATAPATIDYLLEQGAGAGHLSARKMFGDYGLYCDGIFIAVVCDDQLFIKPTPAGEALAGMKPAGVAYPGAKTSLLIPGERWEDADWLANLLRATAANLPPPKPKTRTAKPKRTRV